MHEILERLGIKSQNYGACYGKWIENKNDDELESYSPINGELLAKVYQASADDLRFGEWFLDPNEAK